MTLTSARPSVPLSRLTQFAAGVCASVVLIGCKPAPAPVPPAPAAPTAEAAAASAASAALAASAAASASAALAEAQTQQAAEAQRMAAEVERLRAENAQLKAKPARPAPAPAAAPATAAAMLAEVNAAVVKGNADAAAAIAKRMSDTYPNAPETALATRQVATLRADQLAAIQDADRLAALGFRALPVSNRFSADGASIQLTEATITRQWRFDAYDGAAQVEEADRGNRFVTATATLTSKKKDPNLMGVGVYRVEGGTLVKVGELGYRFARWDSRDAYLGNQPDLNNDFSRRPDVRFSLGTQVDADQLKGPIYLVATREGCHRSNFKRERTPQLRYNRLTCSSLKPLLTVSDFKDGQLGVLKVLGAAAR